MRRCPDLNAGPCSDLRGLESVNLCNLNLKGFSNATSLNRYLERWIGDLLSLILMDMILSTINNPSNSKMVTEIPLKARTGVPIFNYDNSSVSAMCTGRIECSLETKVQFIYWTLCWVWLKTFICTFVLRGETTPGWPGVNHSLAHFLCLYMTQSQQERHLRTGDMADQTGLGKSRERYTRNLLKREWQVGKVSNSEK